MNGNADAISSISAVDLFCGAGGLTHGLLNAGIDVVAGVDIDPACAYPYRANNRAKYLQVDVEALTGDMLDKLFAPGSLKLLAGCAPCQPFSTYSQGRDLTTDRRWNLLEHFARLIRETQPEFVTMENVPRLAEQSVFATFVQGLVDQGYKVSHSVVNCADYGVPQLRKRLVLLASRIDDIRIVPPTSNDARPTVFEAIGNLRALAAGEVDEVDRLHHASGISELNLKRIKASKPGGSWRDWPEDLVASCHRKKSGGQYVSVYGRMTWDQPSPTVTTQFFGFGNGRFGHPEQDRGLSLREGAILQSFPKTYRFVEPKAPVSLKNIGRLIGNAVPVKLGEAIGRTFVEHVRKHAAAA
jgi:DNA (cytosine-5)-methyltransferase 1